MKLTCALVHLFRSPGWCELPDADWRQLKPYAQRRAFVNEINEQTYMYRLNDKGEKRASRLLQKRGQGDGRGLALQERTWTNVQTGEYGLEEMKEAVTTIDEHTEPPIRMSDHVCGILVQMTDARQTVLEFGEYLGWEKHRQFGDDLKHPMSDCLEWVWRQIHDLKTTYQEVILWSI